MWRINTLNKISIYQTNLKLIECCYAVRPFNPVVHVCPLEEFVNACLKEAELIPSSLK